VASAAVRLYVRALKGNGLSYPYQTWYTFAPWQSLGMHLPGGQKVKGQGHTVTKTVTVAWLLMAAVTMYYCYRRGTARRTTA